MTDATEISDEELTELLACRKRRAIPFDLKGTIDGLVARLSRTERERDEAERIAFFAKEREQIVIAERDALKERVERMEEALEEIAATRRNYKTSLL